MKFSPGEWSETFGAMTFYRAACESGCIASDIISSLRPNKGLLWPIINHHNFHECIVRLYCKVEANLALAPHEDALPGKQLKLKRACQCKPIVAVAAETVDIER